MHAAKPIRIDPEEAARVKECLGPEAWAALDGDAAVRAHNKQRKDHEYACWTCGRSAAVQPGLKLMACKKCLAIDRKIWYCSK